MQALLQPFIAAQPIEPSNRQRVLAKPVAGHGILRIGWHDGERQPEFVVELVLPLLRQHAGADDQAALQVTTDHQFLDIQPGHDGLSAAGVIGQQETQRLAGQHLLIDRGDLMRQRDHIGCVYCQEGVEVVSLANALGFHGQPEVCARAGETPTRGGLQHLQIGFTVAVQQLGIGSTRGVLVKNLQHIAAVPLGVDDTYRPSCDDTLDIRPFGDLL